jgi:hypothetical protein
MKKMMALSLIVTALVVTGCSSKKEEARASTQGQAPVESTSGPSAPVARTTFAGRLALLSAYSQGSEVDGQTYLDRLGALFTEARNPNEDGKTEDEKRQLSRLVARLIPLSAAGVEFPAESLIRYASSSWDQDTAVFVGLAIRAQGYRRGALLLNDSWPEALDGATAWRQWAEERGAPAGEEGLQYRQIATVFTALAWMEEQEGSERKLMACAGARIVVCEETLGGGLQ